MPDRATFHFLHVRKTGGTAIKEALRPVAAAFRLLLHSHQVKAASLPPDERYFLCLREPADRFVSGFNSRLRMGRPRYFSRWSAAEEVAFRHFKTANELAEAIDAKSSLRREAARAAIASIKHLALSQSAWLENRASEPIWVGFTESLDLDFARLRAQLQLPAGISLPADPTKSHRAPPDSCVYLSPRGRANVRSWYSDDVALVQRYRQG
jgi:Sulfotransferase family